MDNREITGYSQLWNNTETSGSERSSVDLTNNHIIDSGYFNHTNLSSEDSSKMNQSMSSITIACPDSNNPTPHIFSGIAAMISRTNSASGVSNITSKQLNFVSRSHDDSESKSSLDRLAMTNASSSSSASSSAKYLNLSSSGGLRLSTNNLFGSDSHSFSDGFHTPKEGFNMASFKEFPASKVIQSDTVDSLSSSYEEKKQSMGISGLKRSSPNDVTTVPEVKHRNPLDHIDTSMQSQSNGEPTPSRLYSEFQIDEIIGSGIFGTVYRAHCRKDPSQVFAIKRSRRQYRGRQDKHKMLREVDALEALSRLNDLDSIATIVKYISYWVEDHYVCIQMELCDCSVESMLAANPIREPDIFTLLHDILLALSTLHRHEYVHLDIKPANIMSKAGRYKLGDFGLAVHTNHGQAASNAIEEGDCRYMARELLDWGPVNDLTKCDIFSLGITAHEIVTHIPAPVNGPQWHALRDGSFALPSDRVISPQIVEILNVLLTPQPLERPSAIDCLNQYFFTSSNDPAQQRSFIASLNAKLVESLLTNK